MQSPIGCHASSWMLVNRRMSASAAKPTRAEPPSVAFNLGAIALAVVLGGLALAYAIDAASRNARQAPHRADVETTLTRTIGGKERKIPLSWFRFAEQRVEGFA